MSEHRCRQCGTQFQSARDSKLFCTSKCRDTYHNDHVRKVTSLMEGMSSEQLMQVEVEITRIRERWGEA